MRPTTLLFAFLPSVLLAQSPALMPWPAQVDFQQEQLRYTAPLNATIDGPASERVAAALARWSKRLAEECGPSSWPEPSAGTPVKIHYGSVGDLTDVHVDGSYKLNVSTAGITIDAPTDIGALHALATLYQSLQRNSSGGHFPALRISDQPRFVWRGLMIDPCRHYMPPDMILRQLDAMELLKMNVLHLHLSEDQGFRIESKEFPELQEKGSEGQYLTQADIRRILHQADLRGIRVVPEFDLPGHSTSWFVSHPELASAPGPYAIETRFGVFDPTFNPTNEATYTFLDRFLGEMAQLFPDPYLHIGGDENNGKQWDSNMRIQAFMKTNKLPDNHALQAYFNQRLHGILTKHGKRMIGWDEIGEATGAQALPQDINIQSWRGQEGLVRAARAGSDAILSNGWYIDLCQSTTYHYHNDPLPADSPLSTDEQRHVLGGEATMWAELVDARNVDSRIWPRTAAIAERLWSPREVNDDADLFRRLEGTSAQLEAIGMRHKSAQQELLRLIADSDHINALKALVDVLQPVQGYERHRLAPHRTFTPLTGLADAAVPDPAEARRITALIDAFLASRSNADADALREAITAHDPNPSTLPCCTQVATARADLSRIALQAVDILSGKAPLLKGACKNFKAVADKAKGPLKECVFADYPAFMRLLGALCPEVIGGK